MRPLMIAAALALVAAVPVQAQPAEGHKPEAPKAACHGADGKAAPCKSTKAAPKTKATMSMITRCRDVTSHQLAKCGGPNAEPVPAN
jgi:hypothetical protein